MEELAAKWYVVHTYSGYENKVKTNLEKIVENRGMGAQILETLIPTELVTQIDGEVSREVESKVFPSYVLVHMVMTDETWHIVRNVRGVTGFVGPGSRPVPLSDEEVVALGIGSEGTSKPSVVKLGFAPGDTVQICGGLLAGSTGIVEQISQDNRTVTVKASMFGRDTSIELSAADVKRLAEG